MKQDFYDYIFNQPHQSLVELNHQTIHGIILSKQLQSNNYLTQLTISLHDISDLYVLLDGLVPNLIFLSVHICHSTAYERITVPDTWPEKSMSYLHEFRLQIKRDVNVAFEQLCYAFMPLNQVKKLKLDIRQWTDKNQEFAMLIESYLPNVQKFFCSIAIMNYLDMNSFETLNQRWPMAYTSNLIHHIYTIPFAFEDLCTSILAKDDTTSICPDVLYLVVDLDEPLNLSDRCPMTDTLIIESKYSLSSKHFQGFRRLRCLTIPHPNSVPFSLLKRIHTLILTEIQKLLDHSTIYPNVRRLIIQNNPISLSIIIKSLAKTFLCLRSIEIILQSNKDYYDNLNIFLDHKHFLYLVFFKININEELKFCTNIQTCIISKTSLKWSPIPFYVHSDKNNLYISY